MKRIFLIMVSVVLVTITKAQSQLDTFKLYNKKTPSAFSKQLDTVVGKGQRPISGQPSDGPVPPPLNNPIDNPTSGQTNKPENTAPADIPPPIQRPDTIRPETKPVTPLKPKQKRPDYDTLPGTKRNG